VWAPGRQPRTSPRPQPRRPPQVRTKLSWSWQSSSTAPARTGAGLAHVVGFRGEYVATAGRRLPPGTTFDSEWAGRGCPRSHGRGASTRLTAGSRSTTRRYDRQVIESEVYAAIGEAGFTGLVRAFYAQVPGDDILGPMYPKDDLAAAEERLRDFLVFRFGGPARYAERRGHPRLRARHAPFHIDRAARERWVTLMLRALDQQALTPDADALLRAFFSDTASFLINRPG
jgi:hemoglobin